MPHLEFDLRRLGGITTRTRLGALGHPPVALRRAVDAGSVVRLGRSWLALPDASSEGRRAVARGGILGGESALRSYGIWVTADTGVCIATARSASRLPSLREGEYRVWREGMSRTAGEWRVRPLEALAQYLPRVDDAHHIVATIDSVLHQGLLAPVQLDELLERMPRRIRRLRTRLDPAAESGLESILRMAISSNGWRVDSQVQIPGVGRVDLLIDGWLVIEADGSAWHDHHEAIERDRERNSALVLRGYRWHRFGARQILHDLERCIEVIRKLLGSGRRR
jgi:very-short-patch-repair endonuclease